jgi:hypothetical protein
MDFMLGKKGFFFFTDHIYGTCRTAMPTCNNFDYVNYFTCLKDRLFVAYGLQLLPVFNYGRVKSGEELHILTIL